MTEPAVRIDRELDGTVTEYDEVSVNGPRVEELMTEIFTDHWARVTVGPFVQGAAWEIRLTAPPKMTMLDAASAELARIRRVARAAFFRSIGTGCAPRSWGLRLWNGRAEQMITVLFRTRISVRTSSGSRSPAGRRPGCGKTCARGTPGRPDKT